MAVNYIRNDFNAERYRDRNEVERKKAEDDFHNILKLQIAAMRPNPMQQQDPQAMMQMASGFANMMSMRSVITEVQAIREDISAIKNMFAANNAMYNKGDAAGEGKSDEGFSIAYYVDENAKIANAKMQVFNADKNALIYEEVMKDPKVGMQLIRWDGYDMNGKKVPSGNYQFEIVMQDSNGAKIDVQKHDVSKVMGGISSLADNKLLKKAISGIKNLKL